MIEYSFSKNWLRASKGVLPLLLVVASLLPGCKEDTPEATQTGTETNWLKACDASDECGIGTCICGRCTYECTGAADCASAPEPARCSSDAETAALCGGAQSSGICLAAGTSSDDDTTMDDDATVDDDATDDDATMDDDAADDDTLGDDDGIVDDDDVIADDDASGGAGGNDGVVGAGSGGTGAGGSVNNGGGTSQTCDPSCSEVCADGVCGCACEPTADWAACETPSDCVLLPSDCCACFAVDAVNAQQAAAHDAAVCPEPMLCDACQPEPDPYRTAACIDNVCTVVQLDETPLTECTTANDCVLREPTCCPSCSTISDPVTQLVAVSATQALEVNSFLCGNDFACDACITEFPEDVVPACDAGRCVVTTETPDVPECPAPEGTPIDVTVSEGTAYQCIAGAVSSTLITSEEELDDFFTQCESLNVGPARPTVDYSSRVLFAAVVSERPDLSWVYAVATPDAVHVGVDAPVYCGGVFPRTGALLIEMDVPTLPVELDVCYSGVCSGPLPP